MGMALEPTAQTPSIESSAAFKNRWYIINGLHNISKVIINMRFRGNVQRGSAIYPFSMALAVAFGSAVLFSELGFNPNTIRMMRKGRIVVS
jgi:hypothetical protein